MLLFSSPSFGTSEPQSIDSKRSYEMVIENPSNTFIIDIRSRAEYEFVGHPDLPNGVPNVPYKFYPSWQINKDFVNKVTDRYERDDTVITMCRSGTRAKSAGKLLLDSGFIKVFYMTDSFEGSKDEKGHKSVSGWKVNGLPYTYDLKDNLIYR